MMCPDRQLISVYYDGELPSPWKEKLESHLAQCPRCMSRLERYRSLSLEQTAAQNLPVKNAQDNVWARLEKQTGMQAQTQTSVIIKPAVFWNRRLTLPLPAAAAAAILIVIALALLWTVRPRENIPAITVASETYSMQPAGTGMDFDPPGVVPVTDLNGVLQYLRSRDSGDILILRLPESRNFFSSGDPAIIKAADYSRRKP